MSTNIPIYEGFSGGRVFLHPLRLFLCRSPALRPVLPAILSDVRNTCTTLDGLPIDAPKFLDSIVIFRLFSLSEFLDIPEIFRCKT